MKEKANIQPLSHLYKTKSGNCISTMSKSNIRNDKIFERHQPDTQEENLHHQLFQILEKSGISR